MTITAEDFAAIQAAHAASVDDGRAGVCWRSVSMLDTRVLLGYRVDHAEHERRSGLGLGALVATGHLELMLGLPVGMPVPVASLTNLERHRLRKVPAGAVWVADGYAVRQAVAPVTMTLAVVPARDWRAGLTVAGRFAPFCARALVLPGAPRDMDTLRERAEFYGIGVLVTDGPDAQMSVAPRAFQRMRFTAAGWRFAEEVYQQVR
jgi:hypothetical protein